MTEAEARAWVQARWGVSRETKLAAFAKMLAAESANQNLIARSTIDQLWLRHIADSAQLLDHTGPGEGLWVDIGVGAGLPGMVIAILRDAPLLMIEPRRRRVEFLQACITDLGLGHARVLLGKVESASLDRPAAIISARAVAPMIELFGAARHLADDSTRWILPKGRSAQSEVATARAAWQGAFDIKPSMTDPDSGIVIAHKVRRR